MNRHLGYVPVQLIQWANQEHQENSLRVYLTFKYHSDCGIVHLDKTTLNEYAQILGVHPRTVLNHINNLQRLKWVSMDSRNTLFVRSYQRVQKGIGQRFRKRVELNAGHLERSSFKPYLMGAVVGYFAWLQHINQILSGLEKRSSKHVRIKPRPLSIRYLSKVTNLSHSELCKRLSEAQDQGLIQKKTSITKSEIDPRLCLLLRKNHQNGEPYPTIIRGNLCFIHPNKFMSTLHLKRYRKK